MKLIAQWLLDFNANYANIVTWVNNEYRMDYLYSFTIASYNLRYITLILKILR